MITYQVEKLGGVMRARRRGGGNIYERRVATDRGICY